MKLNSLIKNPFFSIENSTSSHSHGKLETLRLILSVVASLCHQRNLNVLLGLVVLETIPLHLLGRV